MLKTTREAILAALKSARDIADAAETADRDLTEEERGQVTAYLTKAAELKSKADKDDELRKQLADFSGGIGMLDSQDDDGKPAGPSVKAHIPRQRGASLGEAFTGSAEFKALMGAAPAGRFGDKARVQSAPWGLKALVTGVSDTSAGALVEPQRLGLLDTGDMQRPLTVRALFTAGTTQTDTIEYVRQVSQTNAAAPVAEATSADVIDGTTVTAAAGGLKPESAFLLDRDSTNVKTLAHWMPATKRSLSDASQVRTLIDSFLMYGLEEAFEDQLITGNGVGENLLGINNTSGVQTVAAPGAGEDVFTVTRRARRMVRIGGRAIPTAFVMNPIDWEAVELLRDGQNRFYGSGPFSNTSPTLWGLPVVESEAVAAGTAWCAAWNYGVIWDREQASITVTDSHADYFVRNLVAILAEMRVAFAVLRPSAFAKIVLA